MSQIEITPELLNDLRQKAEWAGHEHWQIDSNYVISSQCDDRYVIADENASASVLMHIAAANPAVVLALVAEVERLRDRLEELECPNCGNQPKFCMCEVEQPDASNADQA